MHLAFFVNKTSGPCALRVFVAVIEQFPWGFFWCGLGGFSGDENHRVLSSFSSFIFFPSRDRFFISIFFRFRFRFFFLNFVRARYEARGFVLFYVEARICLGQEREGMGLEWNGMQTKGKQDSATRQTRENGRI